MKRLMVRLCIYMAFWLGASGALAAPRIDHWVAPSGARVYLVENHDLPMLDVQVDFAAGSARDPAALAGLATLTHGLLDRGAGRLDEERIAGKLADAGAQLSGGLDADRASVSVRTLSEPSLRDSALDVLRAALAEPTFRSEVLVRERARTLAGLKEALTRPEVIAARAFWAALYPGHAYGVRTTPESLARVTRDDLVRFHRQYYTARTAAVTLVGDVTRSEAEAIAQRLTEGLPAGPASSGPDAPTPPESGQQRLPHPAAQAHVLIGMPTLQRGDPDFFALQVGNYTLGGGGFVSRLVREVREKRGLAYSVHSSLAAMVRPGPFEISLQTRRDQADEAVRVVRETLDRFLETGPDEAELVAAKQNLAGGFPLRIDSNRKLLGIVSTIGFFGLPLDYLDAYVTNIERVSAADVRAAFARHLRPEALVTVVVGGE